MWFSALVCEKGIINGEGGVVVLFNPFRSTRLRLQTANSDDPTHHDIHYLSFCYLFWLKPLHATVDAVQIQNGQENDMGSPKRRKVNIFM